MTLSLAGARTALVLIDLQYGTLGMSLAPHSAATVVGNARRLADAAAAASAAVVLVNIAFASNLADLPNRNVDQPIAVPEGGLPARWSDLAPEFADFPATLRITKRQWSAFFGTELDLQLRRRGITTVILGGIATNFGVETTARDAWQLNYDVVVAHDACSSLGEDLHRLAIERTLPRVARVRSTEGIVAALG